MVIYAVIAFLGGSLSDAKFMRGEKEINHVTWLTKVCSSVGQYAP